MDEKERGTLSTDIRLASFCQLGDYDGWKQDYLGERRKHRGAPISPIHASPLFQPKPPWALPAAWGSPLSSQHVECKLHGTRGAPMKVPGQVSPDDWGPVTVRPPPYPNKTSGEAGRVARWQQAEVDSSRIPGLGWRPVAPGDASQVRPPGRPGKRPARCVWAHLGTHSLHGSTCKLSQCEKDGTTQINLHSSEGRRAGENNSPGALERAPPNLRSWLPTSGLWEKPQVRLPHVPSGLSWLPLLAGPHSGPATSSQQHLSCGSKVPRTCCKVRTLVFCPGTVRSCP